MSTPGAAPDAAPSERPDPVIVDLTAAPADPVDDERGSRIRLAPFVVLAVAAIVIVTLLRRRRRPDVT